MRRFATTFALLLFCAVPRPGRAAEPAATKPAATAPAGGAPDPSAQATPKEALHYSDRVTAAGGFDTALSFYHATNEQEKKLARAMARVDVTASKVEVLLREKFDKSAVAAVLHAMRNETEDDIDAAAVVLSGDKARVEWKDAQPPYTMVRVDGAWKVDVAEVAREFNETYTAEQFVATNEAAAELFDKTAEELRAGKYPNAPLLERAMRRRMEKLLGD